MIIPPFASNSIILHGLLQYLKNYFQIHVIDIPGFRKDITPISEFTLDNVSAYISEKLKRLSLSSYFLAGISFSFQIVNRIAEPDRCKGIIAISPYTDRKSIKLNPLQMMIAQKILDCGLMLDDCRPLIKNPVIKSFFSFLNCEDEFFDMIEKEMDIKTVIRCANLIFSTESITAFIDIPYVLCMDRNDFLIDYTYTEQVFKSASRDLLIVDHHLNHTLDTSNEGAVKSKLDPSIIPNILSWFQSKSAQSASVFTGLDGSCPHNLLIN